MPIKIIAHRGHTKNHPENTLSAFQAALHAGADAIELDVHFTRDSKLVVHHDYYLGHPDNGDGKIHEKDLAYIQSLTIDGGEHIPTLEEVFQAMGSSLDYEIELKGFGETFLTETIALVKKYQLVGNIEFTSPHAYTLTQLKEHDSHLKTGRFATPLPTWMDKKLGQALAINDAVHGYIDVLHCPIELIDKRFVQAAHDRGLLVHAADCDTNETLQLAINANVDQLSTNDLERALQLVNNKLAPPMSFFQKRS